MKLFKKKNIQLLLLSLGLSTAAMAQEKGWGVGEVEDTEVYIEKDINVSLPTANRSFEKVPPPAKKPFDPQLTYKLSNFLYPTMPLDPKVRVLTIKQEPKPKYYNHLVKGGFGNYVSPYFEAFLTGQQQQAAYGVNVKHHSFARGPVNKTASGQSVNRVAFDSKYYTDKVTLTTDIAYQRNMYRFYGYNPEITEIDLDTTKQVFNDFSASFGLQDKMVGSPLHYSLNLQGGYYSNLFAQNELLIGTDIQGSYDLNEQMGLRLNADFYYTEFTQSESVTQQRSYFSFEPVLRYQMDALELQGGVKVVSTQDTLSDKSLNIFPYARAAYALNDRLNVSAELSGDNQLNTLKKLSGINPFIEQDIFLTNTVNTYNAQLALDGSLSSTVSIDLGAGIGNYKNMYYFVNNASDTSKFSVVYDQGGTQLINLYAGLEYAPVQNLSTSLRGEYFIYNPTDISQAWHKPSFKLDALASYRFNEKLRLGMDMSMLSGIATPANQDSEEATTLSPFVDLGLKADYSFSDRAGAFVEMSNLLNQSNYRWTNYQSRGIQLMVGGSYAF